jgi:hypothetical protein
MRDGTLSIRLPPPVVEDCVPGGRSPRARGGTISPLRPVPDMSDSDRPTGTTARDIGSAWPAAAGGKEKPDRLSFPTAEF